MDHQEHDSDYFKTDKPATIDVEEFKQLLKIYYGPNFDEASRLYRLNEKKEFRFSIRDYIPDEMLELDENLINDGKTIADVKTLVVEIEPGTRSRLFLRADIIDTVFADFFQGKS